MKTLLVVGSGSIGTRHARNARLLGLDVVVSDVDESRARALAQEVGAKAHYADYKKALAEMPEIDAAVIATPSGLHVEEALYLAGKGMPIFMEKPLATSLEGLDELVRLVGEKKLVTMMGQSYRWHEGFLKLKTLLESGVLGKVLRADHSAKEYLPNWHPERDYRQEYAAQKRLGGGALFTSMSHTLDFIEWLFGTIVELKGRKERLGDLEMDADDTVSISGKTDAGVAFDAHNDYISKVPSHTLRVVGEKGEALLDMTAGTLNGEVYAFEPNQRYVEELKYFAHLVETNTNDPSLDLAHGAHIVTLMCDTRIQDLT